MLEMTLATDFVPGVNLKGLVSGATWLYLLPRLNLQRIVCFGTPLHSTMGVFTSFSQEVFLVVPKEQTSPGVNEKIQRPGIKRISYSKEGTLPIGNGCVDLIFLADEDNVKRFLTVKSQQTELLRLLAEDGLIYFEGHENFLSQRSQWNKKRIKSTTAIASKYWLTPLSGEMQTAVPYDDLRTVAYFLQAKLYSPMLDLSKILSKQIKSLSGKRKIAGAAQRASTPNSSIPSKGQPPLKRSIRKAGFGLLGAVEQVEQLVDQRRPFRRYGVFCGGSELRAETSVPRYMHDIAEGFGHNLNLYRWGLSARGEYGSRKMLFYLFDQNEQAGSTQPKIIVKMVRDPSFSYRLENEAHSLLDLEQNGFHDPEVLPKVMFSGRHAGLAIVGESIIEGVPFREKTSATAECPFGQQALDWFVGLGEATADTQAATPHEIGRALAILLERFKVIYEPTSDQYDFLVQQVRKISHSDVAIPLVFQHGDPGPWNMLVTPEGRVAILDWEAAEAAGVPAWDLFYFMRSYSLDAARKLGINNRLEGFKQQFLNDTALSRLFIETIDRYRCAIGLDAKLIEPLFYTCWMHRALKESMRLEPTQLAKSHFANLIWYCREHRDSETLRRLFSLPAALAQKSTLQRNL